jgi:sigma-E factor negative regulatory protein RseC
MIEQNVQVVRCTEQRIWVRMGSQSGCTACDKGNGCGAGVFAKLLQRKPAIIELPRQAVDVKPGQMVTLAFPEQVYLMMVLAYYGWPLLAALIGAAVAYALGGWLRLGTVMLDVVTLLGGLLAGSVSMRALKKHKGADTVMNSLQMAVYHPSATPEMCSGVMDKPNQD